ncbi:MULTISPECIES: YbfB/YjiJ family MFS transporter [unclassified Acinetobacter]|uniref:YbfB/YjiJ family MFS transporter n=1 Tax=unclassified Acinetobacter TaxID=196816 RepID=UPI0018ABBEC4|nr:MULTISPECIES: YbfB/YjiJ family MFS transporter [unclassified Acinetobacter]MBJ9954905.1 YbfB/YjiJ family MFS transporter [Acinetobacter baumannii]
MDAIPVNRTVSNKLQLSVFLCLSTCLAIGILRFSYTALLPSTRLAYHWDSSFASLLGSANLLGYLIGALWSMKLPQNASMPRYLVFAFTTGAISLFSCAFSGFSEIWYVLWRIVSGISGGLIMILAPSIVAQCCKVEQRLSINFIGFSGIGIGVLFATLFLPYLDRISTQSAWMILFAFSVFICVITIYLLQGFKTYLHQNNVQTDTVFSMDGLCLSVLIVYACSAFAYVPHSLFWIDYLKNTLHLSLDLINFNWILYGAGSALGAISAYLLARKFGNFTALKILYGIYIVAILVAIFSIHPIFTYISSFFTGLLNPAVVFLTSYTILNLYHAAYKKLWSIATLGFAITQLIGGLCFSALQHWGISYHQQFILASVVLMIGTLQFIIYTRMKLKSHA